LEVVVDANGREVRCDEIPKSVHCLRMRAKRVSHANQSSREHLRSVNLRRAWEGLSSGKLSGNIKRLNEMSMGWKGLT
jgi:hypothetical protein